MEEMKGKTREEIVEMQNQFLMARLEEAGLEFERLEEEEGEHEMCLNIKEDEETINEFMFGELEAEELKSNTAEFTTKGDAE